MNKQRNLKSIPWGVILRVAIGALIGGAGGIFIGIRLVQGQLTLLDLLVYALAILLAVFININIHEFGHYIFGKALGYRLLSYRIAFLAWNNESSRMKFSLMWNKGYGGLCAMLPPQGLPDSKHAWFYGGGLILNSVTGILFILMPLLIPGHSMLQGLSITTGVVALFLAILNFAPFISANNPTDGKILWSLMLKHSFADKLMEYNRLASQLAAGMRPRDIQVSPMAVNNPGLLDLMGVLYAYFHALDSGNHDEAGQLADILEKNLARFPVHMLPAIYYELCYTNCIKNNLKQASEYYQKAKKVLQRDRDVNGFRVKAYYEYYVTKNHGMALTLCQQGLAVAAKFAIPGQAQMEADLLRGLASKINQGDGYTGKP